MKKYLRNIGIIALLTVILFFFIKVPSYKEKDSMLYRYSGSEALIGNPAFGEFVVLEGENSSIEIPFDNTVSISGFRLVFPGDIENTSISTYSPSNIKVFYKEEGNWTLIEEKENSNKAFYDLKLKEQITTSSFKVVFENPHFENKIKVGGLTFYKRDKISLFESIFYFLLDRQYFPSYLVYSIIFWVFLLLPGYSLIYFLNSRKILNISVSEEYFLSLLTTVLILALLGVFYILFHLESLFLFILPFFFVGIFFLVKDPPKNLEFLKHAILIQVLILMVSTLLQTRRDFLFNLNLMETYVNRVDYTPLVNSYFGYSTDNTLPWSSARVFLDQVPLFSQEADAYRLGRSGSEFFDRTPLLHVSLIPILGIFGDSHFIFQRVVTVLMTFYFAAFYFLLNAWTSKKKAFRIILLLFLTAFISFRTENVEKYYKLFSMVPVFIGIYYYFKEKRKGIHVLLFSILFTLSVMIHPMNILFLLALGAYSLTEADLSVNLIKKISSVFLLPAVSFIFWLLIGRRIKSLNLGASSSNFYVSKFEFADYGPFGFLYARLLNLVSFILPKPLVLKYIVFGNLPGVLIFDYIKDFLVISFISVLSPFVFFYTISIKKIKKNSKFISLGLLPHLLAALLYNGPVVAQLFPVTSFFLFLYVNKIIGKASKRKQLFLYGSYIIWNGLMLYLFSGLFEGIRYINPIYTLLAVMIIVIYLSLAGCLLIDIKSSGTSKFL